MGNRRLRPCAPVEPERECTGASSRRPAGTRKVAAMIDQLFRSYLIAYLFWFGIALGCLPLLMLHHLVGGTWGFVIRRILEAGTRTLPLMIVLFMPILLGVHHLYEWSRPDVVAHDEVLQAKHGYLNVPFFVARAALYFLAWTIFA